MSGAPIMSGINQLPKPPMSAGIITKKIMITPCAVMNTLYMFFAASSEASPVRILEIEGKTETPVPASSARIAIEETQPAYDAGGNTED